MADQDVTTDLHRAEAARTYLAQDIRRISRTTEAVARQGSRAVSRARPFLIAMTALAVVILGATALMHSRRRQHRAKPANKGHRPIAIDLARTILISAAGALAARLAKGWPLALPSSSGRVEVRPSD